MPTAGPPLASGRGMYGGGSLLLIAIGAILYWAVHFEVKGINLQMVGLILMIIGVIGGVLGLIGTAARRRRLS